MTGAIETRTSRSPDSDYTILLPGTWATIPLDDEAAFERRVGNIVKRQVGTGDRQARQRRQMRDELIKTVIDAKAGGADSFALSLELLPGVPFPAAMLTSVDGWAIDGITESSVEERLAASFPAFETLPLGGGHVARRAESGRKVIGSTVTPTLRMDYRVPRPDGESILKITISAPMIEQSELFVALFDAMVDSITWN